MVKEKELKKIKFNQLLIDTQATFMQEAKGINTGGRHHSNTVYPQRGPENAEASVLAGNLDGQDAGENKNVANSNSKLPEADVSKGDGANVANSNKG